MSWEDFANFSSQFPLYKQEGTPSTQNGGFVIFFLVSMVVWVFDMYVNIRQHRRYSDTEVDSRLLALVDKLPASAKEHAQPVGKQQQETEGEKGEVVNEPATEEHCTEKQAEEGNDDGDGDAEGDQRESMEDSDAEQSQTYRQKIEAKFPASQAYAKDKSCFGFIQSGFSLVQGTTFHFLGYGPFLWDFAGQAMFYFFPDSYCSDTMQACFFVTLSAMVDLFFSIPFSAYRTFVVEQRHGFNKTSAATFVKDIALQLFFQAVLGLPILALLLTIIEKTGPYFFVYATLAVMGITFFMMSIYPNVIAPCFNKFEPLPDGSLKDKIEALAASQKFPLRKLFTIDGSKRSAHSNAYLYGFCNNKRIVLFDTLLEQCSESEIVAILGHEIGHWKMGHTVKNLIISQVQIFLIFFSLSFFVGNKAMFHTFGYSSYPTFIGMTLFQDIAFTPLNPILQFAMSYLTRVHEFQADAYAAKLGHSKELQVGLVKLQLKNLGALAVDPVYSAYHYSHPPVVERLNALLTHEKKEE